MGDVTDILTAIERGDERAADVLLPIVYEELRLLASRLLRREGPGQTLQATALVHEAYLRLVGSGDPGWAGRRQFFASAAEAMRRILVDSARRKQRLRHGGGRRREELDEALAKLAEVDAAKAELVKLRYFAGLTFQEAAAALGIPVSTAKWYWTYARTWLYRQMGRGPA